MPLTSTERNENVIIFKEAAGLNQEPETILEFKIPESNGDPLATAALNSRIEHAERTWKTFGALNSDITRTYPTPQ